MDRVETFLLREHRMTFARTHGYDVTLEWQGDRQLAAGDRVAIVAGLATRAVALMERAKRHCIVGNSSKTPIEVRLDVTAA